MTATAAHTSIMVLFNGLWIAREAPAALFYFSGALYGTAAGIVSSALPQPSAYVPRMLKVRPLGSRA